MGDVKLSDSEVQAIWRRVERARRYTEETVWPDLKRSGELYEGLHYPGMRGKASKARVVVNYCQPMVEIKVGNLAFNYPKFMANPQNREGAANAPITERMLAYDWREAAAQREAKRALRDMLTYGQGTVLVNWLWETEPFAGQPGTKVEGARPEDPADMTPTTDPADVSFPMETVRTDRPFTRRLSPYAILVDPESDSVLEDATFTGYCEYVPLDEVKRNPRYKNTRGLTGSTKGTRDFMDDETRKLDDKDVPSDSKRVKLIHYFEKARRLHFVFCDEHKKPLLGETWTWEGDTYPMVALRAPDDEDKPWPMSPLLRIEHQQCELNESRTQHSNWRRQASPKFQSAAELNAKQRKSVASGEAGVVIEGVGNTPLSPLPTPPLQKEVLEAGTLALQDIERIAGLTGYETSNAPSKRMTTTEVQAIASSGASRQVADRQAFEMFCAEIAQRMLALEQQYSVRSRELPIFGPDERLEGFSDYTREQIRGKYLVEVHVGSTAAPNQEAALEGIGWLFQSFPNFVGAMQAAAAIGLDLRPVLPRLIRAALPELRDVEQVLLQQLESAPPLPMMAPMAEGAAPPDPARSAEMMPEELGPGEEPAPEALLASILGG